VTVMPRTMQQEPDDLTIVLLPHQPTANEVLALAREWTTAGLLRAACWVMGGDVKGIHTEVPEVSAALLSPTGEDVGDLFGELGRRRLTLVRLVAAQLMPTAEDADPEFGAMAQQLGTWVQRMLPLDRGHSAERTTHYVRVSLIIPASGVSGVDSRVVAEGWDVSAVAAPEDRPAPQRAADFVRAERNFTGHALLHIASAGGLLAGVDRGTFDDGTVDGSASYGRSVQVVRVWARSVLGERTTDDIADAAMHEVMSRTGVPLGAESVFVESGRPDALVTEAAEGLKAFDNRVLGYRSPRHAMDPVKAQSGVREAFRDLVRFSGAALAMYGRWVTGGLRRAAESTLTEMTYGSQGAAEVKLRPDRGVSLAAAAEEALRESQREGRLMLGTSTSGGVGPPTPALWWTVRGVALGLLDGDMPAPYEAPQQGNRREIVVHPGWIAPEADDGFTVSEPAADFLQLAPERRSVRSADARTAAALALRLGTAASRLKELRSKESDPSHGPAPSASPSEAALGAFHDLASDRDVFAESLTTWDQEAQGVVDGVNSELSTWIARRSRSLSWGLTSSTGLAIDRAERDIARLTAETAAAQRIDPAPVDRARIRFCRLTSALALVSISGLGLGWGWQTGLRMVGAAGAWLAVAAIGEMLLLHGYHRAHSAFERMINVRLHRIRHAAAAAVSAISERNRLGSLYEQLLDWSDIIARVARGPWDPSRATAEDSARPIDAERLPSAMQVAFPDESDACRRVRELRAAVSAIMRPGWLRSAYAQLTDLALDDVAADLPARIDMIDSDVPHSSNGTRRRLLDALEHGEPQRCLADRARDIVADEAVPSGAESAPDWIRRLGVDATASEPEPIGSFVAALVEPPPAFTHGIWSSAGLVSKRQAQGRSVAWVPGVLAAASAPDVQLREAPRPGDGVLAAGLRCDYSPIVSLDDLVLFAGTATVETDEQPGAVVSGAEDVWT
jgi:hypothetical protein